MIPLVSVQKNLGFLNPATLSTRKGLCSMHGLDMLVEVGIIFQDCVTYVTYCYNPFVSDFFMLNLAEFSRTRETAIPAGKHCKTNSRPSEEFENNTWSDFQKENV